MNEEQRGTTYRINIILLLHNSDLTLKLPFTLTHAKPKHKVVSQMVTLPHRTAIPSTTSAADLEGKAEEATATAATTDVDSQADKEKEAAQGSFYNSNNTPNDSSSSYYFFKAWLLRQHLFTILLTKT